MRVVLTSIGTVGDVQPLIALSSALRQRGHKPVFALPVELLEYPQRYHFETHQIGPDLREATLQSLRDLSQGQKNIDTYHQSLLTAAPQAVSDLLKITQDADLLISTSPMMLGRIAHDLSGIPFISIKISFPYTADKEKNLFMKDSQYLNACHKRMNRLRRAFNLPPLDHFEMHKRSPQLALYAMSKSFLPPDHPWLNEYQVTGYFSPVEDDWQPPDDLIDFFQTGLPPVVINLGSMIHENYVYLAQTFLKALEEVGCRAVLQSGWTQLTSNLPLPKAVYKAAYIPHSWLFPQAACVIHHGGVGTTLNAYSAGTPAIILPHLFDQFAIAQRAMESGGVSAVIPLRALNVEVLSKAIRQVITDIAYKRAAEELGRRSRDEQGTETACLLIENFVAHIKQNNENMSGA